MSPHISLVDLVSAVGAVQGIFLAAVLAGMRERTRANLLLALFVLAFALLSVGDILWYSRLIMEYPHFWLVFDPLIFALAPLCYLYVRALTGARPLRPAIVVLHFLPVMVLYALLTPLYIQSADIKMGFIAPECILYPDRDTDGILIAAALQMLLYLGYVLRLLWLRSQRLQEQFSYREKIDLRWLQWMIAVLYVLWLAFLVANVWHQPLATTIERLLFPVAVYGMGYLGMRQSVIFREMPEPMPGVVTVAPTETTGQREEEQVQRKKYGNSTLTAGQAALYAEQIRTVMEEEHLYRQPDLKLQDLADRLDVQPHHLSQVLNEQLGKNFFDVINAWRVDDVQRRLRQGDGEHLTLLALAFESGFNSKAAFNHAFKKHTGLTPSQYRRSLAP